MTIWKYPLPANDKFVVDLPKGAKVLSVQMQNDAPQMWVLVDSTAPKRTRNFYLAGTGERLPLVISQAEFIGTFQTDAMVWHLFDLGS